MTVPQSILVVALALVWLVVLVPTSSRRFKHVREVVDGRGFRVLRRPSRPVGRKLRRGAALRANAESRRSEDEMATQHTDLEQVDDDPQLTPAAQPDPETDAERTVQLALVEDEPVQDSSAVAAVPTGVSAPARERPTDRIEHAEQAERPIPRRPGRGTYDPEVAERDRAIKYARRRQVVLGLLVLVAGFTAGALLFSQPVLWIGTAVSAVLLVLFLLYLRRQVRIEADIRARRLARLQRARQIRPEFETTTAAVPGARPHRVGRTPVDLDDDDPSFDHLEQYEPVEYRRAVGQ